MVRPNAEQVVTEVFQRLDELIAATRGVREAVTYEELRRETFSYIAAETGQGAVLDVQAAPTTGEVWEVTGISVQCDNAARRVVIGFGIERPIAAVTTDAADGIGIPDIEPFVLPDAGAITARFPAAVAAGTRCRVHVWGTREVPGD